MTNPTERPEERGAYGLMPEDSSSGLTGSTPASPTTERPEERDSLEERLARWERRLTEKERLLDLAHRTDLPPEVVVRIAALEAEVKELREENARLRERVDECQEYHRPRSVTAQMEEALRKITTPGAWYYVQDAIAIARAALSPSDTEEEA
jgi:hypothetical protein